VADDSSVVVGSSSAIVLTVVLPVVVAGVVTLTVALVGVVDVVVAVVVVAVVAAVGLGIWLQFNLWTVMFFQTESSKYVYRGICLTLQNQDVQE